MESPSLLAVGDTGGEEKPGSVENLAQSADPETRKAENDESLFGDEDEEPESVSQVVAPAQEELTKEDEDEEEEPSVSVDKSMLRQESQENGGVKSEPQEQTQLKELVVPQSHEIVIPNYARWFNLLKIHSIERQSLPEFFTNRVASKTPQVYVKYRNFMVNSYRLNPNEYFSVTAARRNVSGDAAAIFRVHKFLMKWGLINYQVDAKLLPKNVEPPFTGEFSTRHDAPRGLFPFESYKPSVQLPDMAKLKKMMDTNDDSSALYKYLEERKRKMSNGPANSDAGEGTVKDEEQTQVEEDQESSKNPVKRARILEDVDDQWSREDLQKLLKGLQEHGSDWYKIAKGIDTKTPEQCILKFLQLPIEDRFLHSPGKDSGPLKYAPHLPFSKSDNPVMSTVAFLVGLVDPKVVQQMTRRAITAIEDTEKEKPKDSDELKDASEIALSSLGTRSHVFATNEERQINAISHELVEVQLAKSELKLQYLNKIERALELEKKTLQRQQEDTLVQRLALSKHSHSIYQKFQESLAIIDDKEKLTSQLSEIKRLLDNPPKLSIGAAFGITDDGSGSPTSAHRANAKSEDEVKPVSIEAPQFYRYWSA